MNANQGHWINFQKFRPRKPSRLRNYQWTNNSSTPSTHISSSRFTSDTVFVLYTIHIIQHTPDEFIDRHSAVFRNWKKVIHICRWTEIKLPQCMAICSCNTDQPPTSFLQRRPFQKKCLYTLSHTWLFVLVLGSYVCFKYPLLPHQITSVRLFSIVLFRLLGFRIPFPVLFLSARKH
jgi:hypothetical protein